MSGEIPSFKVYEDDSVMGFLDVMPRSEGMCIVVPKKHYADFNEDLDTSSKVFDASVIVGEKIRKALDPLAVFFSSLKAQVPHFHARVYPVYKDTIPLIENKPIETNENQLISLAEKIKSASVDWKRKEKVVEVVKEVQVEKKPEKPPEEQEKEQKENNFWLKRAEELP